MAGEGQPEGVGGRAHPLRVLHCMWSGDIGGAERALYQLLREQLRDPTIEPAILYGNARGPYAERARELGVEVIDLGLPNGRAIGRVGAIRAAMRPFDLHHFHAAEPLLMVASLRCEGVRRAYTHRAGFNEYPWKKRLQYELVGFLVRRGFHGFSGNTAHAARSASRLLRVPAERFSTTYNGIEFELLDPKRPAAEVREELGLAPNAFVVGTAAHLRRLKRIDLLIEAVAAAGDPRIRLVVLGDGDDRARLEALTGERGLGDRVIFTGMLPQVPDYLNAMDAFCLPSMQHESFGNAAVEAMVLGLPTIVFSDGGGLVEHIEPGRTGFIVADADELAGTLRDLAQDPALGERVGAAGSAHVREAYTLARAGDRYRELYSSTMRSI